MSKIVRGLTRAIVAAAAVAAAVAYWPTASSLHARRARTLIGDAEQYSLSTKSPATPLLSVAAQFTASRPARPTCGADACAEAGAADTLVALSDFEASGRGEAAAMLMDPSLGGEANFEDGPNVVFPTSFEPSATAAATPEISTAAMMTLGLAGLVLAARRARRTALEARQDRPARCAA